MSFDKAVESTRWTLSFGLVRFAKRGFGARAQPGLALPVSNLFESVDAGYFRNTTRNLLAEFEARIERLAKPAITYEQDTLNELHLPGLYAR
jgi:hypothetical protein